jgi:hypothetical protein
MLVQRERPAGLSLAGVHRLAHGQLHDAVAIEPGGERVADAANRLLELLALALDLLDLRLELAGHAVELTPQLSELVVALDRNRVGEVAATEAASGREELGDLRLEGAAHERGRGESEQQEDHQQAADHQAVAGDPLAQLCGVPQDQDLDRRPHRFPHTLDSPAEVGLAEAKVARVASTAELGPRAHPPHRRSEQVAAAKDAQVEPRQSPHARE